MRLVCSVAALSLCLAASCSNKIEGDVTIDGAPFSIEGCESGERNGFAGVDLDGSDGRRLRVVQTPSGAPTVFLFTGEAVGTELGSCGSLTLVYQNSTINNIRNVKGHARLDCASGEHQVKGSVTFENCH